MRSIMLTTLQVVLPALFKQLEQQAQPDHLVHCFQQAFVRTNLAIYKV